MKKKLYVLFALIAMFSLVLTFVACGEKQGKLQNDGIVAEGKFANGVTLSADKIESADENYTSAISKIEDKAYNKEKLAVYDISLVNGGAKVQPSGKVKITIPAPFESETGYVTYHISGETVEELKTTASNGKITFETGSFSYFAVTAKVVTDITALELDASNFGFAYDEDGTLADKTEYIIGSDANLDAQNVLVKGVTKTKTEYLSKEEYTIDLGGLNLEKEGIYTITYTLKADTSVKATLVVEVIDADKIIALELDASNFGFAYDEDGTLADKTEYIIGSDANLDAQNVLVKGVTRTKTEYLSKEEYTIDLGGLNLEKAGTYTITYTLKADTTIKASLVVKVVAQ